MAGHDGALHKKLDRDEQIAGSADRRFGYTFTAACLLIGVVSFWRHGQFAYYWLAASGAFALIAAIALGILAPFNKAWMTLAVVLSKVMTPIVMGVLFFGFITPLAHFARRKDSLRLKRDPAARSYWIPRDPPGPAPESLKHQF